MNTLYAAIDASLAFLIVLIPSPAVDAKYSNSQAQSQAIDCHTDNSGGAPNCASFSNYGSIISLAAPGVDILSTYVGGGYATVSGTSMSAAHVSGVAGLI